jgi:hypothetical protein
MFMCLHAWKYKVGEVTVEAEPPEWAKDMGYVDFIHERRDRDEAVRKQ